MSLYSDHIFNTQTNKVKSVWKSKILVRIKHIPRLPGQKQQNNYLRVNSNIVGFFFLFQERKPTLLLSIFSQMS